jgi:hypothetical protein
MSEVETQPAEEKPEAAPVAGEAPAALPFALGPNQGLPAFDNPGLLDALESLIDARIEARVRRLEVETRLALAHVALSVHTHNGRKAHA